ncbi:hypothetical protein [Adhaeribacter terreus]|uniref:Uncharacterized protein n=1 Tax=Adhaeribacter terreus TaxID=529703 RepID=A0ABW0EC45_9BACT
MKPTLIIFLSVLFNFSVVAQTKMISLAGQRTLKPIQNIEIAEVIDVRDDKSNIGWVQKGLNNKRIQIEFAAGLKEELKWFLITNAAKEGKKVPVIVKVNKFSITESDIGDIEYKAAEVALEFLAQETGQPLYCLLLQTGSSLQTTTLTSEAGGHANLLARVLEDCFTQFSELNFTDLCAAEKQVPPSFLEVNTYNKVDPQTIPMLAAKTPQSGVFMNFQEFKNNAPGYSEVEVTFNKFGNYFETYSGKKIKDFWGYSDGKKTYIRFGGKPSLLFLTKRKDQFTFVANVTTTDKTAVAIGSALGGVAGGIIAQGLTANTHAIEFSIHPLTGMINPVPKARDETDESKISKIVVYRNSKHEKPEPLNIYINDSLAAEINTRAYSEFIFNNSSSEKNICVEANERICQKITPVQGQVLYLQCNLSVKGDGKPVLKRVTEKEAEYYLKIIKYFQSKNPN